MADVYCDQALATGADDGTSWTDAYRLLSTALNAANTGAGDTLWVKNDASIAASVSIAGLAAPNSNPPNVIGCIAATTATPPTASDIVPGLRNGSGTRAYDQTAGNAPPTLTTTTGGSDISVEGVFGLVYGLALVADDDMNLLNDLSGGVWEECRFQTGNAAAAGGDMLISGSTTIDSMSAVFKNCKLHSLGTSASNIFESGKVGVFDFVGCVLDFVNTGGQVTAGSTVMNFSGCDFSGSSSPIIGHHGSMTKQGKISVNNCKVHASSAFVTGSVGSDLFNYEFIGTSSATGKTTGQSFQEVQLSTRQGSVVNETTAVRTGGADDGASGTWALAFTPVINETRDNYVSLIGPWMAVEVTGDGTAQTLTVYIANSGAADYNDDDVWLEAVYPSESGTAQYDRATSQMDLLATPTAVTDDTGSTWGTGGSNHQKLSVSISPDYDGYVRCRVHFAKLFASSPETLYVDPLPVLS